MYICQQRNKSQQSSEDNLCRPCDVGAANYENELDPSRARHVSPDMVPSTVPAAAREREQVGNAERRKWSGMVTVIIFGVSTMITIAVHGKISLPAIILSKTTFALLGRWRLSFTSSATVCSRQRKTSAVTTSSVLPIDACIRLQQVSMSSTFFTEALRHSIITP